MARLDNTIMKLYSVQKVRQKLEISVNQDTLRSLETDGSGAISLVTVYGMCREGKYFLLNALAGENLFEVSNVVARPCTNGVDISEYRLKFYEGPKTMLVDCEGGGNKGTDHDVCLITPQLLISDVFVYNCKGFKKRNMLDFLKTVSGVAERLDSKVCAVAKKSGNTVFGHLLIAIRDVPTDQLEIAEGDVKKLLSENDPTADDEENKAREQISRLFRSLTVLCFPQPHPEANKKVLDAYEPDMDADFCSKIDQLRKLISSWQKRTIDARCLTGPKICEIITKAVVALNSGYIHIPSNPLDSMQRETAESILHSSVALFANRMKEVLENWFLISDYEKCECKVDNEIKKHLEKRCKEVKCSKDAVEEMKRKVKIVIDEGTKFEIRLQLQKYRIELESSLVKLESERYISVNKSAQDWGLPPCEKTLLEKWPEVEESYWQDFNHEVIFKLNKIADKVRGDGGFKQAKTLINQTELQQIGFGKRQLLNRLETIRNWLSANNLEPPEDSNLNGRELKRRIEKLNLEFHFERRRDMRREIGNLQTQIGKAIQDMTIKVEELIVKLNLNQKNASIGKLTGSAVGIVASVFAIGGLAGIVLLPAVIALGIAGTLTTTISSATKKVFAKLKLKEIKELYEQCKGLQSRSKETLTKMNLHQKVINSCLGLMKAQKDGVQTPIGVRSLEETKQQLDEMLAMPVVAARAVVAVGDAAGTLSTTLLGAGGLIGKTTLNAVGYVAGFITIPVDVVIMFISSYHIYEKKPSEYSAMIHREMTIFYENMLNFLVGVRNELKLSDEEFERYNELKLLSDEEFEHHEKPVAHTGGSFPWLQLLLLFCFVVYFDLEGIQETLFSSFSQPAEITGPETGAVIRHR